MNTEVKTRKVAVRRKRERPTQTVRPEEVRLHVFCEILLLLESTFCVVGTL